MYRDLERNPRKADSAIRRKEGAGEMLYIWTISYKIGIPRLILKSTNKKTYSRCRYLDRNPIDTVSVIVAEKEVTLNCLQDPSFQIGQCNPPSIVQKSKV